MEKEKSENKMTEKWRLKQKGAQFVIFRLFNLHISLLKWLEIVTSSWSWSFVAYPASKIQIIYSILFPIIILQWNTMEI